MELSFVQNKKKLEIFQFLSFRDGKEKGAQKHDFRQEHQGMRHHQKRGFAVKNGN
jgi:hypothetical protein